MNLKTYPSNKNWQIQAGICLAILLPAIIFLLDIQAIIQKPYMLIIPLIPLIYLLWIYLDTQYMIEGDKLHYRSAFIKGYIAIEKIREIEKGKTIWAGLKPATATKGLLIKYNRYDEIYISPQDNESLITVLLEINRHIVILPSSRNQTDPLE